MTFENVVCVAMRVESTYHKNSIGIDEIGGSSITEPSRGFVLGPTTLEIGNVEIRRIWLGFRNARNTEREKCRKENCCFKCKEVGCRPCKQHCKLRGAAIVNSVEVERATEKGLSEKSDTESEN